MRTSAKLGAGARWRWRTQAAMSVDRPARMRALLAELQALDAPQREARLHALDSALAAELRAALLAHPDTERTPEVERTAPATGGARVGDVIGHWRIAAQLAEGGMGRLFRVERDDGHFAQTAALKLLKGAPGPELLAHFTRERQLLAHLNHPHIARLLDGGATAAGEPWLVMEYVDGVHIDEWCRRQRPARAELLALLLTVCAAVAFAHRQLVLHCDLKPSNVLVDREGRPVLLDFGIARLLDAGDPGPRSTATAPKALTPRYASPEHRAGIVSTSSDVYSLGVVFAELLQAAGVRDGELDAIAARAAQADPRDRYPSVEALADDLQRCRAGYPVRALPRRRGYVLRRFLARNRLATALAAFAALALAGGAGFGLAGYRQAAIERDAALAAQARAEHERAASDAVAAFLTDDLLMAADVNRAGDGARISVLEAIEQARPGIAARLGGQPAVEGRVRFVIGTVLKHLNRMQPAQEELQRAHELLSAAFGAESAQALEALNGLAGIHLRNSDFDLAGAAYAQGHARALAALGPESPVTTNFLGQRIVIAWLTQDVANGIAWAQEALRLPTLQPGASDEVRGMQVRNNLGRLLVLQGRLDEAERLHRQVLAFREQRFGADANLTLEAVSSLAEVHWQRGELEQAEAAYRRMLAGHERSSGRQHATTATAIGLLGRLAARRGEHAQAVALLREAQAISDGLFGPGRYQSALFQVRLAHSLTALGRPGEALPLLEVARRNFERQLPPHHTQRQELYAVLEQTLAALGHSGEAARVARLRAG